MKRLARRVVQGLRRLGLHLAPGYCSSPAAYARKLPDDVWASPSVMPGVELNESAQLALLSEFSSRFKREYDAIPFERPASPLQYYTDNGMFEGVDGEILYCMVRHFRPRVMVEIGSGNSTLLSLQALRRNADEEGGRVCEFIAIEPHPSSVLTAGVPGISRLIVNDVQQVPLDMFNRLERNDILFIDSSHELRIGSDVRYEYLEVLPRLQAGVVIHAHDIFSPAEYHKTWVKSDWRYLFWTEQYLLQAFLAFNDSFEVLWGSSFMHLNHPDRLHEAFESYRRMNRWPGSFWFRKIR